MARNCFGFVALIHVIVLASLLQFGDSKRRKICFGNRCRSVVTEKPNYDVLGAYCEDICYGGKRDIYNRVCRCDDIVTTGPPPCTTSYLQGVVCDWSTKACNESVYCEWRKHMSLSLLSTNNLNTSCDCPLKEKEMKNPCSWSQEEMTLCSVLQVNKMLYADFPCLCDANPPTPPPEDIDVCEYTEHRPAQLTPRRRKRLFAGNTASECNYPGVVGLFSYIGKDRRSVCTATLLSRDTILFDHQCKTVMNDPVQALVDSYDIRMINDRSPTVDLGTITPVDTGSAANALFTAKLHTPVTLDHKCVQPACLPNVRIPAHHIDLDDCRVLGYGDITDTLIIGPQAKKLQEIKVKVIPTSITGDVLKVVREDGLQNLACLNEFSAPLVCSHKSTKEWVTVGIHQYTGADCSGTIKPDIFQVANLLSEAMGNRYYDYLKPFQPKSKAAVIPN